MIHYVFTMKHKILNNYKNFQNTITDIDNISYI